MVSTVTFWSFVLFFIYLFFSHHPKGPWVESLDSFKAKMISPVQCPSLVFRQSEYMSPAIPEGSRRQPWACSVGVELAEIL